MSIIWKDISSYSQGDKDKIPTTFKASVGGLVITVTRHIYGHKEGWFLRCQPWFELKEINRGGTAEEAMLIAKNLVKDKLQTTLSEFN